MADDNVNTEAEGLTSVSGLDDVFETSDDSKAEATTDGAQEAATSAEQKPAQSEDKGESNAVTPTADEDQTADDGEIPKGHVPKAAYHDEKRKRQERDAEIAELRKQLEQKAAQKPEDKIDIFADPDKFQDNIKDQIARESLTNRISLSREMMAELKPDFEEKEARFMKMAEENPSLIPQMMQSANPAKFAYAQAAKQMQLDEVATDPDGYKAKLRAEILKEYGIDPSKKPAKAKPEVTPSLATVSGTKAESPSIASLEDVMEDAPL